MGDVEPCSPPKSPRQEQENPIPPAATLLDVLDLVIPRLIDICEPRGTLDLQLTCKVAKGIVDPYLRKAVCLDMNHVQQMSVSNLAAQLQTVAINKLGTSQDMEDEAMLNILSAALGALRSIKKLELYEMRPYLVCAFQDIAMPTLTELKLVLQYTSTGRWSILNDKMETIFRAELPSLEKLSIERQATLKKISISWNKAPEDMSSSVLPALKKLELGRMQVCCECFAFLATRGAPNLEILTLTDVFCNKMTEIERQGIDGMITPLFPKLKTINIFSLQQPDHCSSLLKMLHGSTVLENLALARWNAFGILQNVHLPNLLSLRVQDLELYNSGIFPAETETSISLNNGMEWLLTCGNFACLQLLTISAEGLWDSPPMSSTVKLPQLKNLSLLILRLDGDIPAFLGAEVLPRLHGLKMMLPYNTCWDLKPMFEAAAAVFKSPTTSNVWPKLERLQIITSGTSPEPEGVDAVLSFAVRCRGLREMYLCSQIKSRWEALLTEPIGGEGPRSPCWPNMCDLSLQLYDEEAIVLEKYANDIRAWKFTPTCSLPKIVMDRLIQGFTNGL